jgi:hypothetical protein
MTRPIPRRECLESYSKMPISDDLKEEYFFPQILKSYVLSSGFQEDVEKLCLDIVDWVRRMGFDDLIFLGETDMPWLSQESDVEQVKRSFKYFYALKIDTTFNGGFLVDTRDILEFINHLFWLTRFNAAFPIVYFTDKNQGLIGNLCKYGNLHVFTLSHDIDEVFLASITQSQFKLIENSEC